MPGHGFGTTLLKAAQPGPAQPRANQTGCPTCAQIPQSQRGSFRGGVREAGGELQRGTHRPGRPSPQASEPKGGTSLVLSSEGVNIKHIVSRDRRPDQQVSERHQQRPRRDPGHGAEREEGEGVALHVLFEDGCPAREPKEGRTAVL
eukprot:363748-Chlamydomonas_euryale.AAC.5